MNAAPTPFRDYYEQNRALADRYFEAWPDERDVIRAAHEAERAFFTKQFGPSLQAVADAIGKNASDQDIMAAAFALNGETGDTISASGLAPGKYERLRDWLTLEKGPFGLLGSHIGYGFVPIFSPREIIGADPISNDLRSHPPVSVHWPRIGQAQKIDSAQDVGVNLVARTLRDPLRAVARDAMPIGEVRERFDNLALEIFTAFRSGMLENVGVESLPAVRSAYRAFAEVFHPWAIGVESNVDRKTRPPSFFAGRDIVQTSADPIAFGAHRALSSSHGWVQPSGEIAYFDDVFSGLRFSIGGIVGEDTPEDLTVIDNDAWLDPRTSIIHEAIIAKWLHAHRQNLLSKSGAVAIRVDEILDMRGTKKHHKGGYRREFKVDISERLMRLESVFVRGQYTDPEGKKHGVKGRLVNVTIDEELDLLGTGTPYAFLVKPGDATWAFYAASTYLTDYYMALARLDVRQGVQRTAYLLGRYFIHQWRVREAHQNFDQPFRIATLIENARIQKESNPSNYNRFREQFDGALDHLKEIGVIADWEYVAGDEEGLPVRGWFAKWVDHCRVVVTPPPSVLEHGQLRAASRSARVKAIAGRKGQKRRN